MSSTHGWQVQITRDWNSFDDRVTIYRFNDSDTEAITAASATDRAAVQSAPPGLAREEPVGLLLPQGVVAAIVEAVKPGPDGGEVARLEDALRLERERVDRLLDRLMSQSDART